MQVGEVVTIQLGEYPHRREQCVPIVKINRRTIWVRLLDGNIVNRKISRDVLTKHRKKAASESP